MFVFSNTSQTINKIKIHDVEGRRKPKLDFAAKIEKAFISEENYEKKKKM